MTDTLILNVTLYMGFRLNAVVRNFYEFAINGRLTSEATLTRNKRIIRLIWFISCFDLFIYLFTNIYWTYINVNFYALDLFIFGDKTYQISIGLLNSSLFFWSHHIFSTTLRETIVDRKWKKLFFARNLMLIMGISYLVHDIIIFFGFYTLSLYNVETLVQHALFDLTYIIIVVTQLLMVLGLNLSFRLSTQVVHGRVFIVAIDKHGRQLFQV